jgi:hypothetical protein
VDIPQDNSSKDNSNKDNSNNNSGQDGEGETHKPAAAEAAAAPPSSQPPLDNDAPPADATNDPIKDLPVVDAPSLDGEQDEAPAAEPAVALFKPEAGKRIVATVSDTISDDAEEAAPIAFAAAPQPHSFRFALLAASIALIAGLGAFVGTLAASHLTRHDVADAQGARTADARGVLQGLKSQLAELNAMKASLDTANRGANAQFAKISDRLASLEHQQADPATKLQRLAEAVDRLDKRAAAAPDITGSIAKPAEPAPAAAPPPAATAHVLNDWIVRDVRNGRALVESRYGGLFVVGSGASLPGVGRVESVRRQDGAWLVVTAKGTITSDR